MQWEQFRYCKAHKYDHVVLKITMIHGSFLDKHYNVANVSFYNKLLTFPTYLPAVLLPSSSPALTVHTIISRVSLFGVVLKREVSVELCPVGLLQTSR